MDKLGKGKEKAGRQRIRGDAQDIIVIPYFALRPQQSRSTGRGVAGASLLAGCVVVTRGTDSTAASDRVFYYFCAAAV
jgi:hypothetical protein